MYGQRENGYCAWPQEGKKEFDIPKGRRYNETILGILIKLSVNIRRLFYVDCRIRYDKEVKRQERWILPIKEMK